MYESILISRPLGSDTSTPAVLDPSLLEQRLAAGVLSVALNAQRELCVIQKAGGVPLEPDEIMRMPAQAQLLLIQGQGPLVVDKIRYYDAREFAEAVQREFPGKMLAYNCSPSFNWQRKMGVEAAAKFQREIGAMGYKFQFVTLAGFHSLNLSMFKLARGYKDQILYKLHTKSYVFRSHQLFG